MIGSEVLKIEISNAGDINRKESIQKIYTVSVKSEVSLTDDIIARANEIQDMSNIRAFDSLHLASAEKAADIILTTDKKFLNAIKRLDNIDIHIENPIDFVMEVTKDD